MDNNNTSRYSHCQITHKNDIININVDQQQQVQNKNQHVILSKHVQNKSCYLNQNEAEPSLYNNSFYCDQGVVGVSFADSGYLSCNLTNTRHSSVTMPRIDEDSEAELQLEKLNNTTTTTPVTRNIHKINALHLTTPSDKISLYGACSTYSAAKVSPIKHTMIYENMEYTPKKSRTEMTPPKNNSPRPNIRRLMTSSTKRRNPSFRDTLYTLMENENELNYDNIENESRENISGMEFSPIPALKLKTPNANNVLQEKRLPLETTAENRLQSSTPFQTTYQPQFYVKNEETIRRNQLLPKSASPKRRQQTFLKRNPSVDLGLLSMQTNQNTQFNFNPAKKLLHFDTEKSTKMLLPVDTKKTENNILKSKNNSDYSNNPIHDVFSPKHSEVDKVKPIKRYSLIRQNAIETSISVPEINLSNINNTTVESMIEASLTPEPCRHATNTNLCDIKDFSILSNPLSNEHFLKTPLASPIKNIDENSITDFSFSLENSFKSNESLCLGNLLTGKILSLEKEKNLNIFNERLLTTPKKITRCKSLTQQQQENNNPKELRYIQQGISADAEKNIILHPYLPCTPPKKNKISKTFLKRLNSFRIKCNTMKKTKTKLFTIDKKFNYVGKRFVDILDRLRNTAPPLERIFFYLNGKDIMNCSMVSRCWKSIIENCKKVNKKRLNYIKKITKIKENRCAVDEKMVAVSERRKLARFPFNSTSINIEPENAVRHGSAIINLSGGRKRVATLERSPPVSPSKRKFHENQKIVCQLDKNVKLRKCPRCEKPSEIITIDKLNTKTNNDTDNNSTDNIYVLDSSYRPNLLIRTPVKSNTKPQVQRANTICASTVTTSTNNYNNSCNKLSATTFINFNDSNNILSQSKKSTKRSNHICKLDFSSVMNDDNNESNSHRRITRSSMNSLLNNHKKFQSLDNLETENYSNSSKKFNDNKNSLVSTNNNNSNSNESIMYAVCSGTTCGFKYCIKCLCEYHDILHKCMDCDYGQRSPNRDDDQMLIKSHTLVGSRQSKRFLRRL